MVKMKLLLAVVLVQLITIDHPGYAQSSGCYGYGTSNTEEAHDAIQTSNGDILVAGETNQNSTDAYLMKFEPGSLNKKWEQTYGTSSSDVAKAVVEHDGDFFFVGYTKNPGNKDIFIVQVDASNGSVKNHKVLGGSNIDVANDIIATNGGNLAVAGHTKTTNGANSVLTFIIEFSMTRPSFTINQQFAYGTNSTNDGNALEQDSDGDFWIVGDDKNNSGSGLLYQLDQNFSNNTQGDVIYKALVNDNNNQQQLNDIEEDGNHVVAAGTGKFTSSVEKNSGSIGAKAAFAIKLDHTTNNLSNADAPVSQMKEFGTNNTNKANSLTTNSSAYTFTGRNNNNDKMLSFKIESDFSSVKWNQVMGGGSTDYGNSIIELNSGNYLNAGKSQSSDYNNGSGNFFLTNITNSGSNCCGNSTSNTFDDVTLDQSETITNNPSNSSFSRDELKLKSNQSTLSTPTTSASSSGAFESSSGCGALPVEFAGFQLDQAGSSAVNIAWSTASETQNNYFTVLRSRSGDNFRSVGRKNGQGTKLTSTEYTLVDDVPRPNATYYYKIRQTDFDGTTSCSNIKAIELGKRSASDLSISHVTTQGNTLAAHLKGSAEGAQTVQLMNSLGQQVARQQLNGIKGEQSLQFNLNQRPQQMLYLRIIDQQTGELIANKKVVAATK